MSNGYTNESQQLLIRIVKELSREPLAGRGQSELADTLGESRDRVFRAVKNLEAAGWMEEGDGGWRLAPGLTVISEKLRVAIADLHRKYLEGEA